MQPSKLESFVGKTSPSSWKHCPGTGRVLSGGEKDRIQEGDKHVSVQLLQHRLTFIQVILLLPGACGCCPDPVVGGLAVTRVLH